MEIVNKKMIFSDKEIDNLIDVILNHAEKSIDEDGYGRNIEICNEKEGYSMDIYYSMEAKIIYYNQRAYNRSYGIYEEPEFDRSFRIFEVDFKVFDGEGDPINSNLNDSDVNGNIMDIITEYLN